MGTAGRFFLGRALLVAAAFVLPLGVDGVASEKADEIVFAVRKLGPDGHWYANFGYYAESESRVTYRKGGKLLKLDVKSGAVTVLLDDSQGGVRDPVVDYDGKKVLFSYRKGNSPHYHLYEINADGSGLKQLTSGDYDDIEPCYLPDGSIVFVSSRAKRWVQCWLTQVAILHRSDGDGGNVRQISSNVEHDNTPWVLPDGRILYQRWEYVDRSQVHYHHLWTTNPDGTQQMVYFGNQEPGIVMIDAKPIPDSDKVVAIFSPGHGRREHDGSLVVLDPSGGPDHPAAVQYVRRDAVFRDPWALSEDRFLAARGHEIVEIAGDGELQPLFTLPEVDRRAGYQCHEPRPLVASARERIVPERTRPQQSTGQLILANVYEGRNMVGVEPGDIKKLLVLESLPKPINYTGGMDPLTYGGSFTLERVVGSVPVESDGSAYLEVPALRAFFFVALDENELSVKRMQSFLTVQPGEVASCVGCHEQRTRTATASRDLLALKRPPSKIEPIDDCPDVFDFPRDIQPVLDALCVDCHDYDATERGGPRAGGLLLTGDRGPMFSHSYYALTVGGLFSDGRNRPVSNLPPRSIGSSASKILKMIDGSHYGATATDRQRKLLRLWIEVGAPYPGTYAALGTGMIGGYDENRQVDTGADWPESVAAAEVVKRRCSSCHKRDLVLPRNLSDERSVSFWQPSWDDPRLRLSRHIVFNLTRPDKSLILKGPLSSAAGGYGTCRQIDASDEVGDLVSVFDDTQDPDFQKLLALCVAGKKHLEKIKRFDMPGFQPHPAYLREMKRYGVLPRELDQNAPIDPYAVDRSYWRSLWYRPSQ